LPEPVWRLSAPADDQRASAKGTLWPNSIFWQ
jgi:hypothetical protein